MRALSLMLLSVFFLLPSVSFSAEKFDLSKNCEGCHKEIVEQWKGSGHAMAHFSKDEFFGKVMAKVAEKTQKPLEKVQAQCLVCHTPKVTSDYSGTIALEGVGCTSCHNIDRIEHQKKEAPPYGGNSIAWLPDETMAGPYADRTSPYHQTQFSEYFAKDSDKLCLLCHEELKSPKGVVICTTGSEFRASQTGKRCVDCHMTEGGEKTHAFRGARNSDILKEAVEVEAVRKENSLLVSMKNLSSHKFPTGNPARTVIVAVVFKKGDEVVETQKEVLIALFLDEEGKPTLAPFSIKAGPDTRLNPDEKREYSFSIPEGATSASVKVLYRLMPDKLVEKLKIEGQEFKKAYPIITREVSL